MKPPDMPHRCATCRHHKYINPRYEANGWRGCEAPVAQWDSPRRAVTGMDSGTRCAVWAGREQERTMIEDEADKAAREIWDDLSDRRGSQDIASVKYDDPKIYEEIIHAWACIIRGAMKDAG